jgi:hypothetical protein
MHRFSRANLSGQSLEYGSRTIATTPVILALADRAEKP